MIRSWRSDRRIGPLSFTERLRENALWPIVIVCGGAAAATVVLLIKLTFGDDLWAQLTSWPLRFAIISGLLAIQVLPIRGWSWLQAFITAGLITLVFFAAAQLKIPIYSAVLGYEPVMIIPVAP